MKLNNSSLLLQSGISIIARFVGVALNYVVLIILTRNLPQDEAGMVITLMTLITGVSLFSRLGVEHWLVRDVAQLPEGTELHTAQGNYLHSAYRMLFVSTLLFIAVWVATSPLMKVWLFDDQIQLLPLAIAALGVLFWNMISTHAIFMKATHHITESLLTQNALPAISMLVLLLLFWFNFTENQNYLWIYITSLLIAGVASLLLVRSWWSALFRRQTAQFSIRQVLTHSLPLAPIAFVSFLMLFIDGILVAALLPNEKVALYGTAVRVSFVCGIFLTALEATIYPRMVRMHGNAPERLKKFFWQGTLLVAGVLGSLALIIGVAGELILSIFGPQYVAAISALIILLTAQLIRGLSLTFSLMFIIQKQVNTLNQLLYFALIVNIIANLILIPQFGIEGSAAASLLANLTLTGGVVLFFVKKRLMQDYD
ncbi:MAG: Membrane protein involved in the export of O-antigen and teichoic acid [uncultured Thiotrichaceae bacterium]|uniref:Membrane protein involved in the export of O-antigen and teichoic acid n=1 Tax=uncultured Thiotrichaceae bacterium TaxID=298394 RepID=A0A6S6TZ24_9GAMM|nr:MAG: Membrane protein involved in the export of O-antigen and teichoic acid [uncultured Thiotrichaceae bacterium]